jgi:hypothetical protein
MFEGVLFVTSGRLGNLDASQRRGDSNPDSGKLRGNYGYCRHERGVISGGVN